MLVIVTVESERLSGPALMLNAGKVLTQVCKFNYYNISSLNIFLTGTNKPYLLFLLQPLDTIYTILHTE